MKVSYERIYLVIARIPRGRVATYGQIADLVGITGQARRIGYALSALPDGSPVPWHRVINAQGRISFPPTSKAAKLQRRLLKQEGIAFDKEGRINMAQRKWRPIEEF